MKKKIESFIKREVKARKQNGVVIGLSGGLDSTVVAYLAVNALGKDKVYGVCMPYNDQEYKSGENVAKLLGIKYKVINIGNAVDVFADIFNKDKLVMGNFMARIRMSLLYALANQKKMLVIGTANKSEWEIGYFTKWGDGAVDIEPIIDVYKTDVYKLAKVLGIPKEYIEKKPSAGLWEGHTDEDEIGMNYEQLDKILKSKKYTKKIVKLIINTQHKRESISRCNIK